jgi:hypothetical protein
MVALRGQAMDRFVDQLDAIAIFIVIDFNYEKTEIVGRYAGRAPGHIAVPMPNNISDTSEGHAFLTAFRDYAPNAWGRKTFLNMSVSSQ